MPETFMLYPIYFDQERKLSKGRKFNLTNCFKDPNVLEISEALKFLDVEHTLDTGKRHPCEPFVYGRVVVQKKYNKKMVVNGIKGIVEDLRKNKAVLESRRSVKKEEKKGYIDNELGLVPRKKNKKKK